MSTYTNHEEELPAVGIKHEGVVDDGGDNSKNARREHEDKATSSSRRYSGYIEEEYRGDDE